MKLSYSRIWDDALALMQRNGALIGALAGVFMFLPALLIAYFLPHPETDSFREFLRMMVEYVERHWFWLLVQALFETIGCLAILYLVLARSGTSVAAAIIAAVSLVPVYLVASVIGGLGIAFASLLLLLPGLYLYGRLVPLEAVMVGENVRNPIQALRRTFALTTGHGWALFGLVAIVTIAGLIVSGVVNIVLSIVFMIVLGRDLSDLLRLIVSAGTSAALTVVLTVLYAAIYRALTGPEAAAPTKGI